MDQNIKEIRGETSSAAIFCPGLCRDSPGRAVSNMSVIEEHGWIEAFDVVPGQEIVASDI